MATRPPTIPVALCGLALVFALASCGDGGVSSTTTASSTTTTSTTSTTTSIAEEPPKETEDPLPPLAQGWKEVDNFSAGFSIGLPPGWVEHDAEAGQGSILSSPDDLITVSITADRTAGALALPLDEFAQRTAEALGSEVSGPQRFRDLVVGRPAPFDHAYDAVAVRATGTPVATKVPEHVLVVAIRREQLAAYVVVVRENAEKESAFADRDTIKRLVRTLRGRPAT